MVLELVISKNQIEDLNFSGLVATILDSPFSIC